MKTVPNKSINIVIGHLNATQMNCFQKETSIDFILNISEHVQ